MKTSIVHLLRSALLAAFVGVLPALASVTDAPAADHPAHLLAILGSVSVSNAGPYVEIGTYQIQVSVKLGEPSARLPDGTWLYDHRGIEGSAAEGTLVVRFAGGRVSGLSLATPRVVAALRDAAGTAGRTLLANH